MLVLENISKTFYKNTSNENKALSGINLEVNNGDFISIIGSNGAGKSTMLNCIAGVHQVNEGEIFLDGKKINNIPEYERAKYIGRVFQDPLLGTSPEMTIEENLALAFDKTNNMSLKWGLNNKRRKYIKEELSKIELGLEKRLKTEVKLLSGGQRQALTLLMATMTEPKLLLLDEHTAALDPGTAVQIKKLTEELIKEKMITTLMVTHNMKDAIKMGNRLIMMNKGEIILDIEGKRKENLTVEKLLDLFRMKQGREYANDRSILSV
ncbi:MAG: ABC transporter ATP-binding protein [Halanaerobiales bacterium]